MHPLDIAIGIEFKVHEWEPLKAEIPRPDGFKVVEEIDRRPCNEWKGADSGKYAVYLLRKRGLDHFSVMAKLTKILGERPGYLGIKDANASTEQLIYVRKKRIESYSNSSFSIEFKGFTNQKLNHTGNRFEITLVSDEAELTKRVETIKREGTLPAFIGYQRFGTRRPITHLIGKALSQRDWCKAVDFILGYPFSEEKKEIKQFRKDYMKRKTDRLQISNVPKQEREVYLELDSSGSCLSALKRSPVKLSFYLEAFQSYLFNRVLSRKLINSTTNEKDEIVIHVKPELCDTECKEVFEEEMVDKNSFLIEELGIRLKPLKRKAFMNISSIELNQELKFSLERGMYATVVLSEILNTDPKSFT
ncbi:MAG: tRNA pseudouridine(13) synthase TruD [Metallosphaera sp.]